MRPPVPGYPPAAGSACGGWQRFSVVALAGSSLMTCAVPFAALGVALAATVKWRHAVYALAGIWVVNQAVGFAFIAVGAFFIFHKG